MTEPVHAIAHIQWLSPDEGGRKSLPPGPIYAANARLGDTLDVWSVIIPLPNGAQPNEDGYERIGLFFLARDNLDDDDLQVGKRIYITEGPEHIVAEGDIVTVVCS